MIRRKLPPFVVWVAILMISLSSGSYCLSVSAQTDGELEAMKSRVRILMQQNKYTEALPLLEKIVAAEPNDAENQEYLGFALVAQANNSNDETERKAVRVRARAAFVKSKQLGNRAPIVDALISSIPVNGDEGPAFSKDIAANSLMIEAEAFFSQGKLGEALADYKKALELDPKLYHAALFAGDVYTHREDYTEATKWYERAIAINPNIETGYRYSATP